MATNQRENARKEKQLKKDRKIKTIIWCILIVLSVVFAGMKLAEIDYSGLRTKIFGNVSSQSTQTDTITLDSSNNVQMVSVNDKLNVLTDTSYTVYDPTTTETLYTFVHGYANPCMAYAGNYTCLYDQGGNRIRLDSNSSAIYESALDNAILCADVSKNGSIIYATTSDDAKATVTLVNRSLKKLMQFDVNVGYVTSVAVDSSGKKCAYSVVNAKGADFVTTVYTINAGDDKPIASFEFVSTSVLDLTYSSSNLFVVCDNNVSVIKNQKKAETVFEDNTVVAVNYTYSDNNQLVFVYADYAQSTENKVACINKNGKIKTDFTISQKVKYICSNSNDIVVYGENIEFYSLSKGEQTHSSKSDDSINSVVKIGSKLYVQSHQVIEITDKEAL